MMQVTILKDLPGIGKLYNHKMSLRLYEEKIMESYLLSYVNNFLHKYEGTVKINIFCYHANKLASKPSIKTLIDVVVKALTNVAFESPEQISFIGTCKIPVDSKRLQRLQIMIEFEPFASNS